MPLQPGGNRSLTIAIVILSTLAVIAALYFARTLFIPVTLACVLALVLAPIVRLLSSTGLPRALSSAAVVVAAMALAGAILVRLSTPAAEWFSRVPEALYRLRYTFREIVGTLQNVKEITEDMAKLSPGQEDDQVVTQGLDIAQVFLTNTGQLITMLVITAVLLYFLLANGYLFLQKTVHILPTFSEKKRAVEIGRDLQVEVSRYLLTITAINLALGCATAATMAAFGLPDPLLWGVLATTLNFMPYAGAILTSVAILLASVIAFPADPLYAIYPPLAFVVLTALEGNVLTPMLVGRRLTLNPVIVFVSLLFWGWLWGVAGLLLAVPLLVITKILCDHIPPLQVVGEYLSSLPPEPDSPAPAKQPGGRAEESPPPPGTAGAGL
jgi:predicted PurR-regulated permease PerM